MKTIIEAIHVMYPGIDDERCNELRAFVQAQMEEYREAWGLEDDVHVHLVFKGMCWLCGKHIYSLDEGLTHEMPKEAFEGGFFEPFTEVHGSGVDWVDEVVAVPLVRGMRNQWLVWIVLTVVLVVALCAVVFFRTA